MKNHILTLVKKDLLLEVRQQYTIYGILLYVASTIYVVSLTMGQPEDNKVWNALFWVIQLFICINAVAKSFLQESKGRMLYFYSISGARDFILSKLIFNWLLMLVMSGLSLLIYALWMGNPLYNFGQFLSITLLGGTGLSLVFTFLAAIAARAQQNAALMAIMGFPIIIPQLLLVSKISTIAFAAGHTDGLWSMVALLGGLDILIICLAVILFPFLWKD